MSLINRDFIDTPEQQALDLELFEAVSSERGALWGAVASVLARGANPNAIMQLPAPLAPPGKPLIYYTLSERGRGFTRKNDIPEPCDAPIGYWGRTTPMGALLAMGDSASESWESVADDVDPYPQWTFFQDVRVYEVLRVLLENGADPNAIHAHQSTSTHPAYKQDVTYCRWARPLSDVVGCLLCRCCELLLAYGADPMLLDPMGEHIFDSINTEHRNQELTRSQLSIIASLVDSGCAWAGHAPKPWKTLLGQASAILNLPLVEGLLALGADPNAVDDHGGNSPLHELHSLPERDEYTCADELDLAQTQRLTRQIAAALLAAGADPTIRNRAGKTAAEMGNAALSMSIDLFFAERERALIAQELLEGKPQGGGAAWL